MKQTEIFEALISDLIDREYAIVDNFIDGELTQSLNHNLLNKLKSGQMVKAGIGKQTLHHTNQEVRRDLISWIEEPSTDPSETKFMQHVWDFINYLNATCYTGLNEMECHYAFYDTGSFYKRHKDQFRADAGRKYSLVTYLNPGWAPEDGGQLVLYYHGEEIRVDPQGGRAVFFKSDVIEHEVLPAIKPRLSIAGWLKRI